MINNNNKMKDIIYELIMNLIFKTIAYDGDGNVSSITKDYA